MKAGFVIANNAKVIPVKKLVNTLLTFQLNNKYKIRITKNIVSISDEIRAA